MVGRILLHRCTRRIRRRAEPKSSAASTYWVRVRPSAAARVTRKYSGAISTPTAVIAAVRLLPKNPVTATAKTTYGRVMKASTTRSEIHS